MQRESNQRVVKFLKELGWLLSSYKDIDFKKMSNLKIENNWIEFDEFVPKNQNKAFLIGCLPNLFLSKTFFPTNDDIAQFVKTNIPKLASEMRRADKLSRTDLIGKIVCSIDELDDFELETLTAGLKKILKLIDNNETISDFFGEWNRVIHRTIKGD